jgi:hypothetical protein
MVRIKIIVCQVLSKNRIWRVANKSIVKRVVITTAIATDTLLLA